MLTLLFVLRVAGQLLSYWVEIPFLPNFDRWFSGAIAYPALLLSQCLIIVAMTAINISIEKKVMPRNKKIGRALRVVGIIYFTVMFIRWLIGITDLLDVIWFQRPIPAFFHLGLAAYLLLVAHYHLKGKLG